MTKSKTEVIRWKEEITTKEAVNTKREKKSKQTLCDVIGGLLAVTSFIAFGSFGTARGAIGFGAGGIGGFAAPLVGVVA